MSTRGWSLLLGLVGLLVSGYLTLVHYSDGQVPLACANAGFISCEEVTTSAESMLGAVPVAALGVVFFGVSLVLQLTRATRLHLIWTGAGLVFVFYLVYAEMFLIGALCVWCTVVHVVTAALFLLAVAASTAEPAITPLPASNGQTNPHRRPASGH